MLVIMLGPPIAVIVIIINLWLKRGYFII